MEEDEESDQTQNPDGDEDGEDADSWVLVDRYAEMCILVAAEALILFFRLVHLPLDLILAPAAGKGVFEGEPATVGIPGLQMIAGHTIIAKIKILSMRNKIDLVAIHAIEFEAHLVGV